MTQKIKDLVRSRKKTVFMIAFLCAGGGYYIYMNATAADASVRYVLSEAEKGTIVVSVSGTGQVTASNQIELKPKASGDVISIAVKSGDTVEKGAVIARLDAGEAAKTVRDAETSLESAELSLAKLKEPVSGLSLMQAENALASAEKNRTDAEDDLEKAYEDGFTDVSDAFLDLPTVMTGLEDILYSYDVNPSGSQMNISFYADEARRYEEGVSKAVQYKNDADAKYQAARTLYDETFLAYKGVSRTSSEAAIENIIEKTYETARAISEAAKSADNLIRYYEDELTEHDVDPVAKADIHLSSIASYTSKANTHLSSVRNATVSIKTSKDAITTADRTIAEKKESLADLKAGTDELDLRSAELTLEQRRNSLADAREKLADYTVRAPFAGKIASVDITPYDTVSSGTTIAVLITDQKIAEISLNEVDAAKVKAGQKATLTFDALEDLMISGEVVEVDAIGTVSQGVVSYTVKIAFDTQDDRVRPGMTATAAIITDVRQDVLFVPNSAVSSQGGIYYVQTISDGVPGEGAQGVTSAAGPRAKEVAVGLSNDDSTEIVSGLSEGDAVVSRTIDPSKTSTTQSPSLFGGGGGGGVRVMR